MRNSFKSNLRALPWAMALLLSAVAAGCGGGGGGGGGGGVTAAGAGTGVGSLGKGPAPVNLGTAGNYAILAQSKITSVPASVITGNLGLSPAAGSYYVVACTEVIGEVHAVNNSGGPACVLNKSTELTTAIGDKGIAFTAANAGAADYTELGAGNIGGWELGPATYKWSSPVWITTNVTLNGGPNDVWIFQIAQGLTVSPGVQIVMAGGALAKNVFWATGETVALDTTVQFNGIVISDADITVNTNASVNGRLLAKTAVTLDHNTITQPL